MALGSDKVAGVEAVATAAAENALQEISQAMREIHDAAAEDVAREAEANRPIVESSDGRQSR